MTNKNQTNSRINRRLLLKGVGGIALGLPLLEATGASAQETSPFLAIIASANGVVQARNGEDEAWWPWQPGSISKASMESDKPYRASGELSNYADKLMFVKGVNYRHGANGCNHASACSQLLTATSSLDGRGAETMSNAESIDTTVARQINPSGVEPFFLHAGMYQAGGSGFNIPSYISYAGPRQQRPAYDSPLRAYRKILGSNPASNIIDPIALRRQSVNDLLKNEIEGLLSRSDLTNDDRHRLDQHFTTIRELEVKISNATLSDAQVSTMDRVEPRLYDTNNHETIQRLHMDLMAFSLSSGYTRVTVLQVGDREDDHEYVIDGRKVQFHTASHRTLSNSYELCKKVDRIQIGHFKYFLDKLSSIATPSGTLLDLGVTVNTNQIGTGPDHRMGDLPYIICGNSGGILSRGRFIQLNNAPNARLLNTLASAVGVTTRMGGDGNRLNELLA